MLPFVMFGQEDRLNGVWKLKEAKSIEGPDYKNGIPRIINVMQDGSDIKMETTIANGNKDTVESEILKPGSNQSTESFTASGRKKIITFTWDDKKKEWVKSSQLTAKNDYNKTEINIVELFSINVAGNEMTLVKNYNGNDDPNGNKDYVMQGHYEKTSTEQLKKEMDNGNGVRFENGITWQKLIDKAKAANKFIFVDCYATWCLPCKKMDQEVYPLNIIGDKINERFISIKVQMDTGKNDNSDIKLTYPIARYLEKNYIITALPTYLFFDFNGNPIHKEVGSFTAEKFLNVISDALDSSRQIYALVRRANEGRLPFAEMIILAKRLSGSKYGENKLAGQVARKYFTDFLYKLPENEFFTKTNLDVFSKFRRAIRSEDKMFQYFLVNSEKVDSLSGLGAGFAKGIVEYVINEEEIQPNLDKANKKTGSPDWAGMDKNITKKYGKAYATITIINAKVRWYSFKKEWGPYVNSLESQVDLLGDLTKVYWLQLNSAAWKMFEHSNNRQQLEKALTWSEMAIKNQQKDTSLKSPEYKIPLFDTYANLLYKLGRVSDAIAFYQRQIIPFAPADYPLYVETLKKMKQGIRTWEK